MEKVTLQQARAQGLSRYFTGKSCKRGHVAERLVSNRGCVECTRDKTRQWCAENRERHRKSCRVWQEANPEYSRKKSQEWREKNLEKDRNRRREYYKANSDKHQRWRSQNRHKCRAASRKWQRANRDKLAANSAKYRASKIQRTPTWADESAIARVYALARLAHAVTGWPHHVDHIVPLQGENVSGLHVENNLQILPDDENAAKGNRF